MFVDLPFEVVGEILRGWLELKSLVRVDSAVCNHQARPVLVKLLASHICTYEGSVNLHAESCALWFSKRKMRLTRVKLSTVSPEISKCLRLHSHSIWYAHCSADAAIDLVALNCRNLKSFTCEDLMSTPNLNAVLGFSTSLQELRLEGVKALEISHFEEVNLPHLDFLSLQRTDLDDELLSAILSTTGELHHLNIGKCINITDEGVIAVAKHCPHLRSIGLSKLQISDGALSKLTELSSQIDNVQIYGNELITDQGVLSVAKNLPHLCNIGLSFCDALTDRSLEHLMKFSAATLETLCVFGIQQVRVDVIVNLLQQCPQLRTLGLDIDFNSHCADIVSHMHNLRNLLVYCIAQDDSLCMIAQHCKQLEKLGIPCTFKVDTDLAAAAHQSAIDAGVGDVRVMHCAEEDAADDDTIYTEKAVLALMDGLVNLRQLWAPDVSGDSLNDMVVQCLWKRLRPQIQFEQSEKKFYLDVLGEITVCSSF